MTHNLFPYQEQGVEFLMSHEVCYLRDDMGLGKSLQALVAAERSGFERILIVYPAVLGPNWKNEVSKWNISIKEIAYSSYSSLRHILPRVPYDCIILDEAHYIKNPNTKRYHHVKRLAGEGTRLWFLSGTPYTRAASDLWTFCSFSGVYNRSYQKFCEDFCVESLLPVRTRWGRKKFIKQYKGLRQGKKLKRLLHGKMLGRKKEEVLKDLPPKFHNTVQLKVQGLPARTKELLPVLVRALGQQSYRGISQEDQEHITTIRRKTGEAKVKAVINYLIHLFESTDNPILLFAHHREVIHNFINTCTQLNIPAACIMGGQSEKERTKVLLQFQRGELKLLVLSLEAAAEGLNLTEANHVVFAELPWNPSKLNQAIARAHRIGQTDKVTVTFLLAENSFDQAVEKQLLNKRRDIQNVVG